MRKARGPFTGSIQRNNQAWFLLYVDIFVGIDLDSSVIVVIILYYAFFLWINLNALYNNDSKRNISLYRDLIEKSIRSKEAVGYLTEAVWPSG